MTEKSMKSMRAQVRNALGSDLAAKASDAFCRAFATPAEVAASVPPLVHAVIELEPVPPPLPSLTEAVAGMRESGSWQEARASAVHAVRTSPGTGLQERTEALFHPFSLLREIYIKEMRERCFRQMSGVRDELEGSIARLFALRPDIMSSDRPGGSPTQACWLNQTIRTWADPRALATSAADKQVRWIDVPQGLRSEIKDTGTTVGAAQHRAATSRTGRGIVVAVIDSEVSLTHPALLGRVIHKRNFTQEPWGTPGAHGTAVAGIIAAQGMAPFTGMAPEAIIYNYKVLAGSVPLPANDFDLACALQQALEDGARIANCSVRSDTPADGTSRLVRACDNAWALGMTIVKSAGNDGQAGAGTITCPGDAQGVIVVGATGRNGRAVAGYSSRGPVQSKPLCPDMVAPGGTKSDGILSCTLNGTFGPCGSGTSFAAPHVSGLLALILEKRPDLTPDEQRTLLRNQCNPAVMGGTEAIEGKGLISIATLP